MHSWLEHYPLKVLDVADAWPRILNTLSWFQVHPRPNRYLRELDIPGVDSKFIEHHKALLAQLLNRVLPPEAIDASATGQARQGFERRYGLKYDEPLIRFRLLDPLINEFNGLTDISVPISQFARIQPQCRRVFITENKINGLSFPEVPDSLVIFGLGYGIGALQEVFWLRSKEIHYWGDIDTHGFAILSQLRGYFPQTLSFLMDRATLLNFRQLWVEELDNKRFNGELANLTPEESSLFHELRDNKIADWVRLEQERIDFEHLKHATSIVCKKLL